MRVAHREASSLLLSSLHDLPSSKLLSTLSIGLISTWMSESQWVVIDDTHSAIVYKGPWAGTDGIAYNGRGNFGKTYNNTLHGITTAGSLSFRFKGVALLPRLFGCG